MPVTTSDKSNPERGIDISQALDILFLSSSSKNNEKCLPSLGLSPVKYS